MANTQTTSLRFQKLQSELEKFQTSLQGIQQDMARSQLWLEQIQQRIGSPGQLTPLNHAPNKQSVLAQKTLAQTRLAQKTPAPVETLQEDMNQEDKPEDAHQVRQHLAAEYLTGQGIEIGALHCPLSVPANAIVQYVDRLPVEQLRQHYPELAAYKLVDVDLIDDGETLVSLADASADFIIANQMIEHCEDPIQTLEQHLRVLKPGGILFMAVPDKRYTFDVNRPLTTIDHLLRDHQQGPRTSRRNHFEEWVQQVDRYPETQIERRVEELLELDYSIHFHVWTQETFQDFLRYCQTDLSLPFVVERVQDNQAEFIVILRKTDKPYLINSARRAHHSSIAIRSIEILSVVNLCQSSGRFEQGHIDTPRKRDELPGTTIAIQGWLIGKTQQPTALRFSVGDRLLTMVRLNSPRLDVIKTLGYESSLRNCGYRAMLDLEEALKSKVMDKVLIEAIFSEKDIVPIGLIQFCSR